MHNRNCICHACMAHSRPIVSVVVHRERRLLQCLAAIEAQVQYTDNENTVNALLNTKAVIHKELESLVAASAHIGQVRTTAYDITDSQSSANRLN